LERAFGVHHLAVEDCVSSLIHTPKIDDFGDYLFIVVHGINHIVETEIVETAELAIFLGPQFVVSNHNFPLYSVEAVIQMVEDDVMLITCTTNGNEGRAQEPVVSINKTPDLDYHVMLAKKAYKRAGMRMADATDNGIAGCFMLVRRLYWESNPFECQGKGVNKIDHNYIGRILEQGYKVKVLKGLYIYHRKYVRKLNWKRHEKGS